MGLPTATLEVVTRRGNGWTAARLAGVIDEHCRLRALTAELDGPILVLDLGGVLRINSVGVRDWVTWLGELRARQLRIVLVRCSPAIMEQVNLVRNFAEGALVHSLLAPYYCERCDLEENHHLLTREMVSAGTRLAPSFPCEKPACGKTFDDLEDSYFAFLDDVGDATLPADVEAAVAGACAALADAAAPGSVEPLAALRPPPSRSPSVQLPVSAPGPRAAATHPTSPTGPTGPAGPADPTWTGGAPPPSDRLGDAVFLGFVVVLLGLLGVITYLLLTLE